MKQYIKKNLGMLMATIFSYTLYAAVGIVSAVLLGDIIDFAADGELEKLLVTLAITSGLVIAEILLYWIAVKTNAQKL